MSYAGAAAARLGWHLNDQGNCYAKPDQAQCDTEPAPVIIFHAALFQNTADTVLTSNGKGCSSTFFRRNPGEHLRYGEAPPAQRGTSPVPRGNRDGTGVTVTIKVNAGKIEYVPGGVGFGRRSLSDNLPG